MDAMERSEPPARPLLEVVGLDKAYGGVRALSNAELTVRAGEVVALCGDNGAGKSTLIKVLAGVTSPDSGEIFFEGQPVHIRRPSDAAHLGIQVVYQDLALCENLDVVENMFLGREVRAPFWRGFRIDRPQMQGQAGAALASLGSRIPRIDRPVFGLSGGQRQCTAVARAILGEPKLVILDEPTAALGVSQTEEVLRLIDSLRAQGRGVLIVSHALSEVLRIADRITVLRLGETVANKPRADWSEHTLVTAITGAAGSQPAPATTGNQVGM
jgi:D-xylose transport system ATP-binding protein